MSDSNEWPESAKNEVSRLESENDELQEEIGRSTARILALQAEGEQITDGEVKKRFEKISAGIEEWTTSIELDFLQQKRDFGREILRMRRYEPGRLSLWQWGLQERTEASDEEVGKLHWLSQLDTCLKLVLTCLIWHHLSRDIFSRDYPPGTEEEVSLGLNYILEAIKGDAEGTPSEESRTRGNKWRSSTFYSLTSTKMFKDARRTRLQKIVDSLGLSLAQLIGDTAVKRHLTNLHQVVITAAADLKQDIACSAVEYAIPEPAYMRSRPIYWPLHESTLKDVAGWRVVPHGQFQGQVLLVMVPGVYKMGVKDRGLSILAKPVLASFDQEAAKHIEWCQTHAGPLKPGRRRRSDAGSPTHSSGITPRPVDGAPTSSRRPKQPSQGFLSSVVSHIKGGGHPQDDSPRTYRRSNTTDSTGSSPSEDKNGRSKSRKSTASGRQPLRKKPQPSETSSRTTKTASNESQTQQDLGKSRCSSPMKDDPNVTPRNTASDITATAGSSQESDAQNESSMESSDDSSSISSTAAMCNQQGDPDDQDIVVEEVGALRRYVPSAHPSRAGEYRAYMDLPVKYSKIDAQGAAGSGFAS